MIHPDLDPTAFAHTHADFNRLTFGCPSCTARVQLDQERARWREAPLRRVTFTAAAMGGHHEWTADLRVPVDADSWRVCTWYSRLIAGELAATYPDIPHDLGECLVAATWCTIGPRVEDVAAPAADEHPSLFEGAL